MTGRVNSAPCSPGAAFPSSDGPSATPTRICTTANGATRRMAWMRHSSQGGRTMAKEMARKLILVVKEVGT